VKLEKLFLSVSSRKISRDNRYARKRYLKRRFYRRCLFKGTTHFTFREIYT